MPDELPLQLKYIRVSLVLAWELEGNPKLHDIGLIAQSIRENGFVDPPKFDSTLNAGKGGLIFGNGRTEALAWMEQQGQEPPRGILQLEDGAWSMPVLFGIDATSESMAKRFAIDHNTLALAGGSCTALDMMGAFDENLLMPLLQELAELAALPLTIDGDALDLKLSLDGGEDEEDNDTLPGIEEVEDVEPRCNKGEIWQLGLNKLYCGDCLDCELIMRRWEKATGKLAHAVPKA